MKKQNIDRPLVSALQNHQKNKPVSFHVPGHKNGKVVPRGMEDFTSVLPYDLTELEGLDDLHHPTGPIQEAQRLTAECYGAAESFFLVGGSTVGNLAMIYGMCQPGDVVLVERHSHKSILHAVELAGVKPVYLESHIDEATGIVVGITENKLQQALLEHPDAVAVVLTYPNYYGVCLQPDQLIQTAKRSGLRVLVDEAHGAHFVLGEPFPTSVLSAGADVVVQSAHKTLPALTMGSYLHVHHHVREEESEQIKRALTIFQSSSPSYLIMASLDSARAYLQSYSEEKLEALMLSIQAIKTGLQDIDQLEVVDWSERGYQSDPLKVTIRSACTLNGYQLSTLFHQLGLDVEMADEHHILLVVGLEPLTHIKQWLDKIAKALKEVQPTAIRENRLSKRIVQSSVEDTVHIHNKKRERVTFWQAEGRLAAEEVTPYPPGIPLIYPGERIQAELLERIYQLQKAGARFHGGDVVTEGLFVVADVEDKT